jgi:hypothetical protein
MKVLRVGCRQNHNPPVQSLRTCDITTLIPRVALDRTAQAGKAPVLDFTSWNS